MLKLKILFIISWNPKNKLLRIESANYKGYANFWKFSFVSQNGDSIITKDWIDSDNALEVA